MMMITGQGQLVFGSVLRR